MLTDNEIIKALECCTSKGGCIDCPLYVPEQTGSCVKSVFINALDLINRQKAEIEELQGKCKMYEDERKYHFAMSRKRTDEAIKEFAERIDELLKRYAHLHKYADKARQSTEEYADGTPIEMVSVWEVLSLKKWEMVEYETMSELQGNIETIANERLLSELEKDFRLLVKEMTEGEQRKEGEGK